MVMRIASSLTALAVILPALAVAQGQSDPHFGRQAPPPEDAPLRSVVLATHNATRADYGAAPLSWSDALAVRAKVHAVFLARTGTFEHDPQAGARPRDGENMSMGTRGVHSDAELIGVWIDERRDFKPGRFPNVSRSGNWTRVGHYTQMVWPETREVGCAVASNARDDILVCRYAPAGNVVGIEMVAPRR